MNLGRQHRSNHVYFRLDCQRDVLVQRCHCTCDTTEGRLSGQRCSEYEGVVVDLRDRRDVLTSARSWLDKAARPLVDDHVDVRNSKVAGADVIRAVVDLNDTAQFWLRRIKD
jgi:hypothetical protein